MLFVKGTAARGKMIACIISGTFLITVLAICKYTDSYLPQSITPSKTTC